MRTAEIKPINQHSAMLTTNENVQGTFQICRKTGIGLMNLSCTEGTALVHMELDLTTRILQELPPPANEYA